MKKHFNILLLAFLVICFQCSQVETKTDPPSNCKNCLEIRYSSEDLKIVPEVFAKYPEGVAGLSGDIQKKLKELALNTDSIKGKTIASFVVSTKGEVTNVRIVKSVDVNLDEAIVSAIKSLNTWEPAYYKGDPINLEYQIPIKFQN